MLHSLAMQYLSLEIESGIMEKTLVRGYKDGKEKEFIR